VILASINRLIKGATILLLSVITVMVSVEVVLRYCFGGSLYVTEELTRYLMVWVTFLACSLAIRDNSHVSIEIVASLFKGRARAFYDLLAHLLFVSFLLFLIIEGILALPFQVDQIVPTLNVSMFWFYLAVPVGGVLMILNLLPRLWGSLRTAASRSKDVPAAPTDPDASPGPAR
jgi:TRAP-type transport system small permease protein